MIHVDWTSFAFGAVAWMTLTFAARQVQNFLDRMIDYYQRKLDEREEAL